MLEDPSDILSDTDVALSDEIAGMLDDTFCPLIVSSVIGHGEQLKAATLTPPLTEVL